MPYLRSRKESVIETRAEFSSFLIMMLYTGLLLLPKIQLVQSHPDTLAQFLLFVVNC